MNRQTRFLKKLDILLLILFPVISVTVSLAYKTSFLTSILLFYGLPSIWFSLRTPSQVAKTFLFSLIISIPMGILIDYIGTKDGSWFVPVTLFPFRLFGIIPFENLFIGFFLVYTIVIFYEHFLDKGKHELVDKKMKYLVWPLVALMIVFSTTLLTKPEILVIPYAYLWLGVILTLIPTITFISFFPRLLSKYVKVAFYFFFLTILFEITGLQLNQWTFPGTHFIGWVNFIGYSFPFEELFFWVIMSSTSILSYYEFFDDDRK